MSEEDDANYRRRISEVLNRHGFGWVIGQVEAQIAEGKPSSKQVSERETLPFSADPMFAIRRPRSRRASLITSEPYTERERLEILLQAIEAAIIQRSTIEQTIFDHLTGIANIRFVPDNPTEDAAGAIFGNPHALSLSEKGTAVDLEAEARHALAHLRERDGGDT